MEADSLKNTITLPAAVTLANNRKSIWAQQKMGAEAIKKRKRTAEEEAEAIAAQEAEAIAVQDECDEQFAQDIEAAMARRDKGKRKAQETPTPTVRSKRVIKKTVRWEPPEK